MVEQALDTTILVKKATGRKPGIHPHKVFSFGLTGEEAIKLERLAAQMGMKPSAYIQRIMRHSLSNRSHHRRKPYL